MAWFQWNADALLLQLHIQPGARHNQVVALHGDRLKLKINAPPVDGRANEELIEYLSQCFDTSKSNVTLVRGVQGRSKTVCIAQVQSIPSEMQLFGLEFP